MLNRSYYHFVQELLAEETGKREALHRQNEQQKQEIATKQQLLRCLMQEKAALEAQLSQLQQQQQQQEQQYKDACKQHVAQTLQLQQQREEEQQKTQQLQGKLEQQQQELLLQQQKLGCLAVSECEAAAVNYGCPCLHCFACWCADYR